MSFGKPKDDGSPTASPLSPLGQSKPDAFLGKGSKIVGTLTFNGPVEIEGCVEGEIIAQERIVIGESAVIRGKVSGAEIVIRGDINGDIHAVRKLTLKRPARVVGTISSPIISMEEGVTFDGKCSMASATKAEHHSTDVKGSDGKSDGRSADSKVVPIAERAA